MIATARAIDISDDLRLKRLAEQVRETRQRRLLRIGDENLAMIVPVGPRVQPDDVRGAPTDAEIEAFETAFEAWRGNVDAEEIKRAVLR